MGLFDFLTKKNQLSITNRNSLTKEFDFPEDVFELLWIGDGKYKNLNDNTEPSLIFFNLPMNKGPAVPLNYYPSFRDMTPEQRFQYLEWLLDINKPTDVGYVFLYYYGLERHLMNGEYKKAAKMIHRLKKIVPNKSFQDYSNSALMYAAVKHDDVSLLDGLNFSYLNGHSLILIKYLFFNEATAEDIINCRKEVGFDNNRYIKGNYSLFVNALESNLINKFGTKTFPLEFSGEEIFRKVRITPLANYSLEKNRELHINNLFSNLKLKESFYELLFNSHEEVKQILKEKRKELKK